MSAPRTIPEFKQRAEAAFKRANPDAKQVSFKWTRCERVTWRDNSQGFSGNATVSAEGYRTRSVVATFHDNAISVR